MKHIKTIQSRLRRTIRRGWGWTRQFDYRRTSHIALLSVIVLNLIVPVASYLNVQERYRLSTSSTSLIGQTHPALTAKMAYDKTASAWQFNANGDTSLPKNDLLSQVGGAGAGDQSLYSLKFPDKTSKGITYTDNQSKLSITLTPQFGVMDGRQQSGRMVYPTSNGNAQLVYTPLNNGLKEDILLDSAPGDEIHYDYKLDLPSDLTAHINDDGSVGMYSADRALFGNIQYGSDTDREKVASARKSASRDTLMFVIPAPVIKQSSGKQGNARAFFTMMDGVLTLNATGLKKLNYPISIDPSVVVTSSSDFATGNNEGNIDFPSGQINRGALTGGNIGNYVSGSYSTTWTTATNTFTANSPLTGGRMGGGSVAYNGYLYLFGGGDTTNKGADVQCSALNSSTGQPGTWSTSTNTMISSTGTTNTGRQKFGYATYNGYLYIGGGNTSGSANDVFFAQMVGGTTCIGAFTQTTAFNTTVAPNRQIPAMTAYNGYMYSAGGQTSGNAILDLQYAPINGDGTLGTWVQSSNLFTTARYGAGALAYNGYLYVFGGRNGSTYLNDVQYAPINPDGSIGTFITTSSFTTGRFNFAYGVYNGYLYIGAGAISGTASTATVQYASVNGNGSLGTWVLATSQFATARETPIYAMYNGYMYIMGGEDVLNSPTTWYTDTQFGKIDAAGQLTNYASNTAMTTGVGTGISDAKAFVSNGFIYVFGGFYASDYQGTVEVAAIGANGVLGAWGTTNAMNTPSGDYQFATYNNCVYILGGYTTGTVATTVTQYACMPASGSTLTWATGTSLGTAVQNHGAAAYNGYIYMSGVSGGGSTTQVQTMPIASNGSISGSWTTATTAGAQPKFNQTRTQEEMVAYNGYLYVIGGINGATYQTSVEYAPISAGSFTGSFVSATNNLNISRANFRTDVINGVIYVLGGENGTDQNTAEYSVPDPSTGAPGVWTKSVTFTTAGGTTNTEKNFAMAISNGFIYLVSGNAGGSRTKNVFTLNYQNGGAGTTSTWTTNATTLSSPYANGWAYGSTFASGGYLYTLGGYNSTNGPYADVWSAPIAGNGSTGTWVHQTGTPLNSARYSFGLVVANGYVYVYGGNDNTGTRLSSLEYAKIQAGGTLSSWTVSGTSVLSSGRTALSSAVWNNYIYAIGGSHTGSTAMTLVEYAPVNPVTGVPGAWTTTTSLPAVISNNAAFAANGYLYSLGGFDGTTGRAEVNRAPLTSGAVGTWTSQGALPLTRYGQGIATYGGSVYMWGGTGASGGFNDVITAVLGPGGNLGPWQSALTAGVGFTTGRTGVAGGIYNGYLYTMGGYKSSTSTYFTDEQYSAMNVLPHVGIYSRLFNLGALYNLSNIVYNGTLPGGLTAISYRTAGSNGVFGSTGSAASLTAPTSLICTTGTVQYVWVSVMLDDSSSIATQPDITSTVANLTDLTVWYNAQHPTPDVRLYQGKFFDNQTLQPLDTCGV